MLVSGKEILQKANEGGYAVGAFNTSNLEITQAIIEAAEEEKAPVIIQVSMSAIKYAGIENIAAIVITAAKNASVPVALHLDHGTDFNVVMQCLRNGWTSIMFDGSKYPFEENVAITKNIVNIAHPMGVSVEAELGKIGGTEDHITVDEREATMTDPDEAVRFVEQTGVDYLAIAIGTAHGVYKGEPKLDFDRLQKIKSLLKMPIVLHGASGVPEESIVKAVKLGVNKINIDTDLRQAFDSAIRSYLNENPNQYDPRKILAAPREAMKKVVAQKIRMFGSSGKA
ncbi:fructose-bisphosphate aldolase, class II [Caldanaerobius fijiensis DSM 17918]|uniref:Fructose-bisphosphate aldolase, class II n=1 Tax=Caldanaerobius fijiensis DSM 17918 TaxID=1121256 RepID=A0A1M4W404_9THEO|nr:class II fructose-1,6-bisphosphate aldolase [Caldanaerobius fijiensis]SHE75885.1 fructose-bisphosphate aldolase, class II [Caldanaerobius fijiensis DSM 17918]